jgi:hypothetical protein
LAHNGLWLIDCPPYPRVSTVDADPVAVYNSGALVARYNRCVYVAYLPEAIVALKSIPRVANGSSPARAARNSLIVAVGDLGALFTRVGCRSAIVDQVVARVASELGTESLRVCGAVAHQALVGAVGDGRARLARIGHGAVL